MRGKGKGKIRRKEETIRKREGKGTEGETEKWKGE